MRQRCINAEVRSRAGKEEAAEPRRAAPHRSVRRNSNATTQCWVGAESWQSWCLHRIPPSTREQYHVIPYLSTTPTAPAPAPSPTSTPAQHSLDLLLLLEGSIGARARGRLLTLSVMARRGEALPLPLRVNFLEWYSVVRSHWSLVTARSHRYGKSQVI